MTYEYVCTACAHQWEAEQRISEPPLTECPACHEPKAKRQISAGAGFILKGSGWYSDGYSSAKSDPKPSDKAEAPKTESPAKTETPKTETPKSDTTTKSDAGKAAA